MAEQARNTREVDTERRLFERSIDDPGLCDRQPADIWAPAERGASMHVLRALFSVRGRVGRSRFWLVAALVLATPFLVGFVGLAVVRSLGIRSASLDIGLVDLTVEGTKARVNTSAWNAILLLPTTIRRMHDRDRSGWRLAAFAVAHLAFFLLAEVAGAVVEGRASVSLPLSSTAESILGYLQVAAQLAAIPAPVWCIVELAFLPGTIGANRHGIDPVPRRMDGREEIAGGLGR